MEKKSDIKVEDIKVGDIVLWSYDMHENNRYIVEKMKGGKVKVRIISPAETLSTWISTEEFEKVSETIEEVQEQWRDTYGYSGI